MIRSSAFALFVCVLARRVRRNSGVVPVSGTLTYKGKPVTNAFINFVPESGRPSMGETDQSGRFTLTYDPQTKGAQVGKHRVFVTAQRRGRRGPARQRPRGGTEAVGRHGRVLQQVQRRRSRKSR